MEWVRAILDSIQRLVARLSEAQVRQLYWLFALLGTLPALRANRLLPYDWIELLIHEHSPVSLSNPLGNYLLVLALITWLLARRLHQQRYLLAVWPYLFLLLGTLPAVPYSAIFASASVVVAVLVVMFFALTGRVFAPGFGAYLAAMIVWRQFDPVLSPWSIVLFVLAVLVSRLAVEAWRQNRPLLRALGKANARALGAKTLSLWWPMLFLIAAGIWLSGELGRRSENALYTAQFIVPYCSVGSDETDDQVTLVCPPGHQLLENTQFSPVTLDNNGLPLRCAYKESVNLDAAAGSYPATFDCPPMLGQQSSWPASRLPLFENTDLSVARLYMVQHDQLHSALNSVDSGVHGSREVGEREARRLFTVVPQTTGMKRRRCRFPFVACEAANLVVGELNNAYRSARRSSERKFVKDMGDRAHSGAMDAQEWTASAREDLTEVLNDAELATRTAIARVHVASNIAQQLLILWLVVAIIKSLLYVFSRVVFDQSTAIDVALLEVEGDPVEGKVSQVDEINIEADYPYDIYYKANYQPLGPAPRFSIPQWRASLLARLRAGAWNMSFVDLPFHDENRLSFNAIEAEHLVDWEMREGEEVVFNYRNFVAMNEHVRLRTVVSFRVATLLLGRMVFHTARCEGGPGRLILRTRGKPATSEQVQQSIPVSRLVAWNRYAEFSVDSHLTPADIFLNGFNLRRSRGTAEETPKGILIVEADARDGGLLVGTLRFAKNFLLPI